jgi:hypothetical protein
MVKAKNRSLDMWVVVVVVVGVRQRWGCGCWMMGWLGEGGEGTRRCGGRAEIWIGIGDRVKVEDRWLAMGSR